MVFVYLEGADVLNDGIASGWGASLLFQLPSSAG